MDFLTAKTNVWPALVVIILAIPLFIVSLVPVIVVAFAVVGWILLCGWAVGSYVVPGWEVPPALGGLRRIFILIGSAVLYGEHATLLLLLVSLCLTSVDQRSFSRLASRLESLGPDPWRLKWLNGA